MFVMLVQDDRRLETAEETQDSQLRSCEIECLHRTLLRIDRKKMDML